MENKMNSAQYVMNTEAIKNIIPHRDPFLLVEGILEIGENRIVGVKTLSPSEPFFKGHFPGKPVMPGVLMIEALAQTGGVLVLSRTEHRGKLAYFASIDSVRFRRMVLPGEQLKLTVEVIKLKSRVALMKGVASVNGEPACEAEMMFSMAER